MPFTTSHPAIVLPLKKLWPLYFSLSGLMAGAVSPDLLYFLILDTKYRGISHSWTGLFVFCLPAGIIFSYAFHYFFKSEIIGYLPKPLDRLFSGLAIQPFGVKNSHEFAVLAVSVLTGALSHFFWDSFTHANGELARYFPMLLEESSLFGIVRQNCTFVQHLSTIVGGIVLPIYIVKFGLIPPPLEEFSSKPLKRKIGFWMIYGVIAVLFAVLMVSILNDMHLFEHWNPPGFSVSFRRFGLAGWAGFFYGVCVRSAIGRYRDMRRIRK